MSSGIVLEMENICGNTERRARFLWWLQRKPQLLGDAAETTHSASRCVAEKIPKCFVTVNIRANLFFHATILALAFPLRSVPGMNLRRSWDNREAILRGRTANAFCEVDGALAMRRMTR